MSTNLAERPWLQYYEPNVRPVVDIPAEPLYHFLDRTAAALPNHQATLFVNARMTYGELKLQADAFAAALANLGVKPGDRVAIMLPNCPQAVVAFYGAMKAGAIVVMTNPLYVERELEHQMNDSGAETLIYLDLLHPRVASVFPKTGLKRLIVTSIRDALRFPLNLLYPLKARREGHNLNVPTAPHLYRMRELLARHKGASIPDLRPGFDDVALLQYTGGTTGLAKGAMLSHRNLVSNVLQVREWMGKPAMGTERMLAVMPFFHVYGLTVCLNLAVAIGATLILVPKFELVSVLKLIQEHKATYFPGAPTIYVAINNYPEVNKYDLHSIKACISGAAALPVEVQTRFEQLSGGRLVEGYGLTEASPVTHCTPLSGLGKTGTIGVPLPNTEMRVVDVETGTADIEPGQEGELCIRGPQVMLGYWNRPEETAAVLRDGWLHTGDIVRVDDQGFTSVVDRKKEMIIAGGFNIYPREVEEVLYEHPAVQEAVAVGVPDEYRGETVKAFVVLKPGAQATPEEIIAFCRDERMAKYKAPTQVEFRTELPKSLIGKILRRVLREEELARRSSVGGG